MKQPDTFAETVDALSMISHIPSRLMLAHLVHFRGVPIDHVLKLHEEYGHANERTIDLIAEYTDIPKT